MILAQVKIAYSLQQQNMEAPTGSQSTISSLDSSLINTSAFDPDSQPQSQSTQSLTEFKPKKDRKSFQCSTLGPTFSQTPEKPRLQNSNNLNELNELLPSFQQPFIGFCAGGKGKQIAINESKVKRAHRFFQDDSASPLVPKPIFKPKQPSDQSHSQKHQNELVSFDASFSIGFKSMGTGANIEISQSSNAVMNQILREFQEISKPTKIKRHSQGLKPHEEIQTNNFRTVVPEFKKNPIANRKKPATPKQRKILNKVSDQYPSGRKIERIKFKDLPEVPAGKVKQFQDKWLIRHSFHWVHSPSNCSEIYCYFCQKHEKQEVNINPQTICQEIQLIAPLEDHIRKQLDTLVELVIFKLIKYEIYYPGLANKQPTPNRILLETHKKCLKLQRGCLSPLMESIPKVSSKIGGKHLNLCVMGTEYSQEAESCFIQLTDGWSCVLAVVSQKNPLFGSIRRGSRARVGAKISIVDWNIHPICNIGDYHPDPSVRAKKWVCIEFNLNNSMPIPLSEPLGWPTSPFYRPVNRCKVNGGPIPLIEGLILRMFSSKSSNLVVDNYVELLLEDCQPCMMKVSMPQEVSLIELFRLYYPYHFRKVKKLGPNLIEFGGASRFQEIEDPQRATRVTSLFKARLLNLNPSILQHNLAREQPIYHDLIVGRKTFKIGDWDCEVVEKVEGKVLLQQYRFVAVPSGFIVCRGERGSCLRRIPKFYEEFQCKQF